MWAPLSEPGLTGAPQAIEWAAIFIGIFVATVVGRLNMLKGKNGSSSAPSPAMGEIAGAIIDKESAEEIITAVRRQTDAMKANTRAAEALATRLEGNTDAAKATSAMIDEARQDIRELTRELVRGKG